MFPDLFFKTLAALVTAAVMGMLAYVTHLPLLFPSLGPTIFIHIMTPQQEAARVWNTLVGHAIGIVAAVVSLWIFNATTMPVAMSIDHITWNRMAASALAVSLTILGQGFFKANHAPAAATTLLLSLGGFHTDIETISIICGGVVVCTGISEVFQKILNERIK
ncbi:HPP family protein [Acetobacter orleanensis]|uniref:HPP transmembrane region domain-containing protein n=1 Tax=Acetobacter orleanensis TaxID=104099 RepID=A0A4Y3TMT3_9PROT|nr:HPP family protein [Acetobacter orleanensis]KXV66535.1 hypothetical protein AD949_02245 [Acetobacter orleanensis]PCD79008.1 HPP family protein [Acetobacter orleanensis]GAN67757.1 hypothetical protein Abol_011_013 [Acetobacter orleanensis JCM 7639]GBR23998.1 hypothetical protein AA0473_0526 [Acetobacter orleanensis NRIC 0473]GEB83094.1 hypothetical protein AOR01nite_15710 [Acetobacter orleanensis]